MADDKNRLLVEVAYGIQEAERLRSTADGVERGVKKRVESLKKMDLTHEEKEKYNLWKYL